MSFLSKIFGRDKKDVDVFDSAPYLAPWYFQENKPLLERGGKPLKWSYVEKVENIHVGLIKLTDNSGSIYAIIDTYEYIHPIKGTTRFLSWNRRLIETGDKIEVSLYDSIQLKSIGNSDSVLLSRYQQKETHSLSLINCEPIVSFEYPISEKEGGQAFVFPSNFRAIPSFIIIADVVNSAFDRGIETVFFEFIPKDNLVRRIPQYWFNNGNIDFSYQWLTRVVRNKKNQFIYGQGIRIDDFILDKEGNFITKE